MEKAIRKIEESEKMHQETNPHLFLQGFLSSDLYKTAYDAFFSEKTIPLEVTQEEKDTTFLGSQEANTALVDYGQGVVHFRYDPDQFNEDENALIHTYMQKVAVRYYQDPEEIRKYERERTQAHNEIAQEFAKNRVPNTRLGLVLARLIVIDRGLDTFDNARYLVKNMHMRGRE